MFNLQFRDYANRLWAVDVIGDDIPDAILQGSEEPLQINYKSDDTYSPIMGSAATLSIIGQDYLQALFTSSPTANYVSIKRDGITQWEGYVTPNVYAQDFSNTWFELEVECVDPLSVLDLIPYGNNIPKTFKDIIVEAFTHLPQCELNNICVQKGIQMNNAEPLAQLSVANSNWYDEEGNPASYKEVLEEIARYLNMTFIYNKGSLYLIDKTSLTEGFWSYSKGDGYVAARDYYEAILHGVVKDNYRGANHTMGFSEAKNKISVVNSLYEIKSIFPDIQEGDFIREYEYTKGNNVRRKRYYKFGDKFKSAKYSAAPASEWGVHYAKYIEFDWANRPSSLNWDEVINIQFPSAVSDTLCLLENVITQPSEAYWSNLYISLSGEVRLNTSLDGFDDKVTRPQGAFNPARIPVEVKIGDYYWTGKNGALDEKWSKTRTKVLVSFQSDNSSGENIVNKWMPIVEENDFVNSVPDLSGKLIYIPLNSSLSGDLIIRFFRPFVSDKPWDGTDPWSKWSRDSEIKSWMLKDFNVKFQRPDSNSYAQDEIKGERDRLYETVIEASYKSKDVEIKLALSTEQNEDLAKSIVMQSVDGGRQYLGEFEKKGITQIAEKHILSDYVTQLESPRAELALILEDIGLIKVVKEPYTAKNYCVLEYAKEAASGVVKYKLKEIL